jgi:PPP family 3-phenylpropionic acid transporter
MALFYAAFFVFGGIQLPFLPAWLEARGLDAREIGLVLAVAMVARVVVVPVTTRLADRFGVLKGPLLAATFAATAAFALMGASDGFAAIFFAYTLASIATMPVMPFADAFALRGLAARQLSYGPVRLWGSVTFIAANVGGGLLLEAFGAANVVWAMTAAMLLSALSAAMLPPLPKETHGAAAERPSSLTLWKDRTFVGVVAAASLIQSSHAVLHGFATLQWRDKGLDGLAIGGLWAIGVLAEIALFAVSKRVLAAVTPLSMIVLGGFGAVLRWGVMPLDPPASVLPVLQCLHALSFGATHLGSMQYLAQLSVKRLGATAQGDFSAVQGLVFAATMGLSGVLVESFGTFAYAAMAVTAAAGAAIAVLARRA